MNLYVWPADFGLASVDPHCLQFLACAKICLAPVTIVSSTTPWKSATGEYPIFETSNKNSIHDFDKFADLLRKSAQDVVLDSDLTAAERCECDAYASLMLNNFHPALLHTLWLDNFNYKSVTQHWYSTHIRFPYNYYYLEKRRRHAEEYVKAHGQNETQLIYNAISTVNLLSAKLGDKKFFYGDKPCSLDALIFGYLAPILKLPLPSDVLQQRISSYPNLVRFVESIVSVYLPLDENQIKLQTMNRDKWLIRQIKAQKEAQKFESRRKAAEEEKEVPIRDAFAFAVGAIVLSVIFAVHCGIIQIAADDSEAAEIEENFT